MNSPTCLVFDLFGTLVEYEPVRIKLPYHRGYAASGFPCTYDAYVAAWDSAFHHLESSSTRTGREFHMHEVAREVRLRLGDTHHDDEALARLFIDDWRQGVCEIPGASGLLRRLSGHYRLGLISNTHYAPMVHDILRAMDVDSLLESVVLSVEVGMPKPAEEIFRVALSELGVDADEAVYIGDSYEADYLGATRAGMSCYLVGKQARVPRDRQLRSVMDLPIYFRT